MKSTLSISDCGCPERCSPSQNRSIFKLVRAPPSSSWTSRAILILSSSLADRRWADSESRLARDVSSCSSASLRSVISINIPSITSAFPFPPRRFAFARTQTAPPSLCRSRNSILLRLRCSFSRLTNALRSERSKKRLGAAEVTTSSREPYPSIRANDSLQSSTRPSSLAR